MIRWRGCFFGPVLSLVLWCGSSIDLSAQQQERKLLERIQRPDMTLGNQLQNKPFASTGRFGSKNATFAARSFEAGPVNLGRDSVATRSFFGIRNPWFGRREFATGSFATEKSNPFAERKFSARPFAATSHIASKGGSDWGGKSVPVKTHLPVPAAPGAVQKLSERISKDLTIDEVRELLNKPR